MKVALINMPFASIYRPSIGLSLLKAGLKRKNINCDIHYLNLKFAELISTESYNSISEGSVFSSNALAGEIVFSESLFGEDTLDLYIEEAKVKFKQNKNEDFELIRTVRSYVEGFLLSCLEEIDWDDYNIIGFTSVFEQNVASLSFAKRLKEKYPDKFIMFGGANCEETMGMELLRQFSFIDAICSGEGDYSFVNFISEWNENGLIPNDIDGVFLQKDKEYIMKNKKRPSSQSVMNLDQLPIPEYSDYFEQFVSYRYKDQVQYARFLFESSRGCWWGQKHHCVFCGLNGTNLNFRSKSAERVLEELMLQSKRYKKYTSKATAVDNIIDMNYFKSLLPSLKDEDINLDMFYETKANLKKSQIELFRDANFKTIQPGIESLQTSVLKLMNKGISMLQNIQLLKWSREYGIFPIWNILYGFPGENQEEYKSIHKIIEKIQHLTPPGGVSKIRLDRFSPYFNNSKENGITNVRAMWPYKYIYSQIDQSGLDNLAYHFDFDYSNPCNPEEYTVSMRRAVLDWTEIHPYSDLFYVDNSYQLIIMDLRGKNNIQTYVLKDEQRQMLLALDGISTITRVHKEVISAGYSVTIEDLNSIILDFINKGIVLEEDGKLINIVLNTNIYSPKKASLIRIKEWNENKRKDVSKEAVFN
ncbi:RiPP maturation radical SAM C-methyltransferase [Lysinibacillus sp. NPDC058147]|uniref:RiPP maturation radical SAM C-methyltransferase n=1 Tax=unclassified Lysinibacillus TaxID=2636778 RepID=UPI0036DF9F8F